MLVLTTVVLNSFLHFDAKEMSSKHIWAWGQTQEDSPPLRQGACPLKTHFSFTIGKYKWVLSELFYMGPQNLNWIWGKLLFFLQCYCSSSNNNLYTGSQCTSPQWEQSKNMSLYLFSTTTNTNIVIGPMETRIKPDTEVCLDFFQEMFSPPNQYFFFPPN